MVVLLFCEPQVCALTNVVLEYDVEYVMVWSRAEAIDGYKAVTYDIPDDGQEHTITIVYRKDGSSNSGTDRGYVLIGKP